MERVKSKMNEKANELGEKSKQSVQEMVKEEEIGGQASDQIYIDPEDPKKKRLDELKRKAMAVAAGKKPKKYKANKEGEMISEISETASVVSDSVSESGFSVSSKAMSIKSASSASTTMPFLTFTKTKKANQVGSASQRGNSPKSSEKLVDFVNPPEPTERKRSWSPIQRDRPLNEDDGDEAYLERVEEMHAEMEDCLEYLASVQEMVKEAEDIHVMQEMDKTAHQAVNAQVKMLKTTA